MTEFVFLSSQPWTDRLAWTLIHFLWQGAAICCAFVAVRALLARSLTSRGRYGLACMALALMAVAPVITFLALDSARSPELYRFGLEQRLAVSQPAHQWLPASAFYTTLLSWIVGAWLTGAFAFSIRLAGGWFIAARLRFAGIVRPAAAEWQTKLDALAAQIGLRTGVRLLISSLAHAPMAVGDLRPVILVPIGVLTGLPFDQVEALLAHELAHIWRHDYLANLLQSAIEALLFYHPAVWWLSKQIRIEREHCCDDIAVSVAGDPIGYARALAGLESLRPAHAQVALAANGGDLLTRIRRLVDPPVRSQARPGLSAAIALGILIFAGIAAATVPPSYVRVNFRAKQAVEDYPLHGTGRILAQIHIRGISEESGNELASRLPVHLGDRLTPESLDSVRRVAEPYGRHIECRIDYIGRDSAILDIHPAGLAGAPVIGRK